MVRATVLALCAAVAISPAAAFGQIAGAPPPAPTDAGAQEAAGAVVMALRQVCVPLIQGGKLKAIATAAGFRDEHGQWVYRFGKNQRIELAPPDPANPRLCNVTIIHEIGAQSAIEQALDNWAQTNKPPLQPVKKEVQGPGPVYLRTTSTWDGSGPRGVIGVVFAAEKTLKGQPVAGDQDQSELMASFTPAAPTPKTAAAKAG